MYIGTLTLCAVIALLGALALTLGRYIDSLIECDEEVFDYEQE